MKFRQTETIAVAAAKASFSADNVQNLSHIFGT